MEVSKCEITRVKGEDTIKAEKLLTQKVAFWSEKTAKRAEEPA
jgi:hypothetical protein